MPNPFSDYAIFKSATTYRELRLEMFDMTGKLLTSMRSSGDALKFEKKNLPTGMYFFKVQGDGRYLGNSKILIQN